MRWVIATGYVCAGTMVVAGLVARRDPRLAWMLGVARSGRSSPLVSVGGLLRARRSRSRIASRLGDPSPEAVDAVLGVKAITSVSGAVAGLVFAPGGLVPPVVTLLAVAGWRLPDFILARRERARRARAAAAVPELLDLVAVSATAGLTPRLALDRVGGAIAGPLGDEMASARRSVELGETWPVALRRTAERLGLRDLMRLSSTLERSGRLGSPVAERIRILAREVRAERRSREEERARRAPVTMLFPLVFLILPAFGLAAVVPTILVATRGIR